MLILWGSEQPEIELYQGRNSTIGERLRAPFPAVLDRVMTALLLAHVKGILRSDFPLHAASENELAHAKCNTAIP